MRLPAALVRIFLIALLFTAGFTFLSGQAAAQTAPPDLAAAIRTDDTKPRLGLKNISERSCQVASTAQGTIAITSVRQNGKLLKPAAMDAAQDEDIGYLLKSQLKTLKPGESITIPLQVYELRSGTVLRATTWSADGGAFSSQYAINTGQPLQLELNYALPITPEKGAPVCTGVFASTIATDKPLWQTAGVIGLIAGAVILLTVALLWFLKKHRKAAAGAAAAILLAIGVGMWWQSVPRAYAAVTPAPDVQTAFDACMATLNDHRDITGPVLDAINNPANNVEIVRTAGGSETTGYRTDGGGNFTIYWNPDDRHPYAGTGGNADPCTTLYHEMFHVFDMHNGTFSREDCSGSGIETKEVMATRAQNALRAALGMPQRSHYGDRALPSGDCTEPPDPARCTGERCGDTNGDPHLRTFDGLRYDFQAGGEFIAARNKTGTFEMQVRQEAWPSSRHVSINTAVAFKVGKDTVEVQADYPLKLLVNGKTRPLKDAALPGKGQITMERKIIVLTWPDGSVAYIRAVGSSGIAISAQPSDELAGKLEGLLGDANGTSANDLRVRGNNKTIKPTHDELYPDFADSWRISDESSLFTYDKGKNTATYTDRSLPDKMPDPKSLPGYAAAQQYCRSLGITDPAVLANCALDMAITGRPEFGRAAVHSQSFAAGSNFGGTTWELAIKNPGDTASVTFDAKAGEKIYIAVLSSDLPSSCSALRLSGPDNQTVVSGCIINGKGEIDGTVLASTGTYTITLAPGESTGTATARLLRIVDKQGSITPDGPAITANIDRPGVVARYTFSGQAGQRIYTDVPSSTLDSQCGTIRLLGANGSEMKAGCIINGKGEIDTAILPETGTYTLLLDPRDDQTGQARLRLIVTTAEVKPIRMDGPSVSLTLKKAGSIGQLTFNGTAGQRVYVDIPSSTLPSQCGGLGLRAPDGSNLAGGCIINGEGEINDDGIVLPVTGQYTIVLDPTDDNTGSATVRLRSR